MNPEDALREIVAECGYREQLLHTERIPGRSARYGELTVELEPSVKSLLQAQGIDRLYSHQAEAIDAVLRGRNAAVVTGTASGKTLCYLIPIVQALARRASSRALLIYPTKALAQDQLRKLSDFGAGRSFTAATYDGDTPQSVRRQVKKQAQVVLTNPDMLHVGILPYHHTWAEFFRSLEYVVIDEMHTYRGVFGSHTANVIRRLRRIAAHYGADPCFICCSATVGSPLRLAGELTGLEFHLLDEDGSPSGERLLGWWNPPLVDEVTGQRASANIDAAQLLSQLAMRGVRSITFTLSRVTAELILRHARRLLESKRLDDKVMAYRAGYLPEQRRAIERRLFDGDLLAVTSTTALELGVDIGGLDAVIMVGYPGSIAGFRQQMGRAGREGKTALAILIGLSGGLHQYLMQHPQFLLQADAEQAALDPRNEFILGAHLLCAAYELPIAQADSDLFGPATGELLEILAEEGFLSLRQGMWYWTQPDIYPAGQISIRSVAGKHYDIVDLMQDTLLGTVDADAAFRTVYPGAIYLHGGETYRVEQLDLEQRRADVVAAEVDYYTVPMSVSQVHVRETTEQFQAGDLTVRYGPVDISTRVIGYRKIRTRDHRELGVEELALPTREFDTYGLWLSSLEAMRVCADGGHDLLGSLHALEHILIGLLPLFAMCDPRDAGGASEVAHPDTGAPTVFIYDAYPGGVGITRTVYMRLGELLTAAAETIAGCPCEIGCPACVQSSSCGSDNSPLDKAGAVALARSWAQMVQMVQMA
jgi:DEAD/DEAH box helicase domain-containing protein